MHILLNRRTNLNVPFLTTWKLWENIKYPGNHPLIRQIPKFINFRFQSSIRALLLIGAIVTGWILLYLPTQIELPLGAFLIQTSLIMFSSSYVLLWIFQITTVLLHLIEHNTYDVFCLPPSGSLGLNWAITAACLHYKEMLQWFGLLRKMFILIATLFLALAIITTALQTDSFDFIAFLRLLLDIFMLSIAIYLDHIQATLLGSLLAMLATTYYHNRFSASTWAITLFLVLQVITLTIPFLIMYLFLPYFFDLLQIDTWYTELSPPLIGLLFFYLSRELLINGIWRILLYQLYANPLDYLKNI